MPAPHSTIIDDGVSLVVGYGSTRLRLDRTSGMLGAIENAETGVAFVLSDGSAPQLEWLVDGEEIRHPPALTATYHGATTYGASARLREYRLVRKGLESHFDLTVECDDWEITGHYVFREINRTTRISYWFDLVYRGGALAALLRRAFLRLPISGLTGDDWLVETPGSAIAPGLVFGQIAEGVIGEMAPGTSVPGVVGVYHPGKQSGLAVWAFSWDHRVRARLQKENGCLGIDYTLEIAARLSPGEGVSFEGIWFDRFDTSWDAELGTFRSWWRTVGLEPPDDRPDWAQNVAIYEVHVGETLFRDGFTYTPFPRTTDLLAHLPTIKTLGFDVIQVMPRHPFPSYTVHDYRDVSTSWGDEAALRELSAAAHSHGMRVILDFVLHGVLDRQVLEQTLKSIRGQNINLTDKRLAEYIVNYASHWHEHAYDHHPLIVDHPDWFVKNEDGTIAHAYTFAFDLANPDVQHYIIDALKYLVVNYQIDGFRFDAPTWHAFPNWDPALAYAASHSMLGAVEFFRKARSALKALRPDLLLYIEATGPLFRQHADANYNYDLHWLIPGVLGATRPAEGLTSVQHITARQMSEWFAQRQKALPGAELTVHHVDSHDTYWWPEPGKKWRREQYGQAATSAVTAIFALIEGGFMSYVGAEDGQEDLLRRLLHLRKTLPELACGTCDYRGVSADDPQVFTALRVRGDQCSVVAVNLGGHASTTTVHLPAEQLGLHGPHTVYDALCDEFIPTQAGQLLHQPSELMDVQLSFDAYQPRLLVVRAAAS